ncbi:hypothetical protein GGR52DRAFT_459788 [Hypoxylon sp. FL1284]|nr:hypothetical protein GGR52DRAFT_459788 [Hypoxylon sp. FL1284]
MVVRTTALNSLKNFFPKIHQPLPLTESESRQLLGSITSSFRKNLDKEHPWGPGDEPTSHGPAPRGRSPLQTSSSSSSASASPPSDASRRDPATDRHMRAILSNPLFARQDAQAKQAAAAPDPLRIFDLAVSRGMMTPQRAAGFLTKVRKELRPWESSDDAVRRGMAASGAGRRVLRWLRASGHEADLRFLLSGDLASRLVPFLHAEGLDDVAWAWAVRLASPDDAPRVADWQRLALTNLLHAFRTHSSMSYAGAKLSLDGSYQALLRANELLLPRQSKIARCGLENVWVTLSWLSTVRAWTRPKPSTPLFDSFVDLGRPFGTPLEMAHLELRHPSSPSHSAAVRYIHANAERDPEPPAQRRRIICLALDAVDRLKQVGDADEASWIERFLVRLGAEANLPILMEQLEQFSTTSDPPIHHLR